MAASRRDRIEQIKAFQQDLQRFARVLREEEEEEDSGRSKGGGAGKRDRSEQQRQDLLRRAGPVESLHDRVCGRLIQPLPFYQGERNVWQLALHDTFGFRQSHFAKLVADHLLELIGRLEADPKLLDPPKPRKPAAAAASGTTFNISGGNVNIANVGKGDVAQSIGTTTYAAQLCRQLAELEEAIRAVAAPNEERESFIAPIEQLRVELGQPRPLVSRLLAGWGAVSAFGTVESAWQGWERVQKLANAAAPQLEAFIHAAIAATSPG